MDTPVCPERTDTANPELGRRVALRTQELKVALARAQSLYDQAPCGHLSLDSELRFVNLNRTLLDWLGCGRDELLDQHDMSLLLDPESVGLLRHRMQALEQTGGAEPLELELRRKDGRRFHVLCASTAVVDAQGRFLCSNSTVADITERKAAERRVASHDSFLLRITDRIPSPLAYYDKDLLCRFASTAFAVRCGNRVSDMIGAHLSQLVDPEQLPEILPHVADALNGQSQTFEAERVESDGARSGYAIHHIPDVRHGAVEGLFIELHDITERHRTEEFVLESNRDLEERVRERTAELFQSEQRYRLMVDALQDHCIYFVNEQGAVTEWTESAQRLHGFTRVQMLGKPCLRLLAVDNAGEDEVDPAQAMRLAVAHGQWETRGWRLRDDGSRFWAHTVLTALRNETGQLQGISCITRDMTAAKSLEDLMNDLNRELEKQVAEIQDPIAQQYLNSITKARKRMSHMIEGLLEYARLGRIAIESQPVPLAPLLDGLVAHLRQENPGRAIEWVIDNELPVVRGDAMLLAQAFGNLRNNSVKYTRPREKARIEVGWKVNPVGGRIWAETAPGEGCTFCFTLPFEGAQPEMDCPRPGMANVAL